MGGLISDRLFIENRRNLWYNIYIRKRDKIKWKNGSNTLEEMKEMVKQDVKMG